MEGSAASIFQDDERLFAFIEMFFFFKQQYI